MNKSSLMKAIAGISGVLGGMMLYAGQAHAVRHLLAEGGTAFPFSKMTCFSASFGAMKNSNNISGCNGSSNPSWDVLIPIDSTGTKNTRAYVHQFSVSAPLQCGPYAIGPTGGGISPGTAFSTFNQAEVVLPAITVPSNGALGVFCAVPINSSVRTVKML